METKQKSHICTSLSIISGKGGCGKTTLALGMAQILANCGIKVLLVDCDLSTHGATYFFENFLIDKDTIFTTYDLVSIDCVHLFHEKRILNVKKNIDFIPSVVYLNNSEGGNRLVVADAEMISAVTENYDVVIYDCQAGYSFITDRLTEISTKNLVVLEPDAVTSSATRVLSSQLGQLDSGNTFQVFNKITGEDYSVYSLVTHGTFYTNLTPVRYDLSVKKAFAFNELPNIDIENTSFSKDVIMLVKAIFQPFRKNIEKFIIELKYKEMQNCERKLFDMKSQKKQYSRKRVLEGVSAVTIAVSFLLTLILTDTFVYNFKDMSSVIRAITYLISFVVVIFTLVRVFNISFAKKNEEEINAKIIYYEKEMEELEEYIYKAEDTL